MTDLVECRSIYGNIIQIPREKLEFRPSAYAIVVHEGKILLLTARNAGLLALPGGGVNLDESLVDGLKREVREETGIEVDNGRFLHFNEQFFYYDPTDEAFHAFLFLYDCKPLSFDLVSDEDVDDVEVIEPRWYDIEGLTASQFQIFGDFIVDYLNSSAVA
jgi:8-oxo-dGTP diphosphatase